MVNIKTNNLIFGFGSSTFLQKHKIKQILIQENAINSIEEVVTKEFADKKILIVVDENTYSFIGEKIYFLLNSEFNISICNLKKISEDDEKIQPTIKLVLKLQKEAENVDIIFGIGSGTINDICKLASFNLGKKYIFFATALSMNGYTSSFASIIENGKKGSKKAHLPYMLFFDLDVLKTADVKFIKAGIADCLVRSFARADWLLSRHMKNTPYNKQPFLISKETENALANYILSDNFNINDTDFLKMVTNFILLSGFGMTMCEGSYPASQSEHMLAHYLEENYYNEFKDLLHGQIIAKTLSITSSIQHKLLNNIDKNLKSEILKDYLGRKKLLEIFQKLDIDCTLNEITKEQLEEAIKITPSTRDRFTFLNLN